MNKEDIREAYRLANEYAETVEEAVQVGIQMAINGEVLIEKDKIIKIQ